MFAGPNMFLTAPRRSVVAYDATGLGGAATVASTAWDHTPVLAGSQTVVIATMAWAGFVTSGTGSLTSTSATCNGVAMTSMGRCWLNNVTAIGTAAAGGFGFIEFFYLFNPPSGASSVALSVSISGTGLSHRLSGNSVSYTGVGSVGALQSVYGAEAGTDLSQTVSTTVGRHCVQAFQQRQDVAITAYNRTVRATGPATPHRGWVMGDTPSTSTSMLFTAVRTSGVFYAGIAAELIPA